MQEPYKTSYIRKRFSYAKPNGITVKQYAEDGKCILDYQQHKINRIC